MKRVVVSAAVVICALVSGVAPASASTGTWRVQSVPEPHRAVLVGVSCPAQGDCTAVSDTAGAAEQWNGRTWSMQPTNGALSAVSCAAPANCTAVEFTVAEHWDGTSWTSQALPLPTGAAHGEFDAVSCASAASCTATGLYFKPGGRSPALPVAAHWDGANWTLQKVPLLAGASDESVASGVSCPTATRCIAVGDYLATGRSGGPVAARWNGSRWTVQAMPSVAGTLLRGVSCPRPDRCTAVGSSFNSTTGALTALVERWNGATWTRQPDAAPAGTALTAVSCPTASWCTAVGDDGSDAGVAEYWDGTSWTAQVTPIPHGHANGASLEGVSCQSAFHCTAVGSYGGFGLPLAEHEN
jgi:hypothetical protein